MATQEEILKSAFGHFANWPAEKSQFEALLHADIHWVETDQELGRGDYRGKSAVMAHLDDIKSHGVSASLISVEQRPPGWQTKDEMQVRGHHSHCCITDIAFTGDLISRVIHCKGHFEVGEGPC